MNEMSVSRLGSLWVDGRLRPEQEAIHHTGDDQHKQTKYII